MAEFISLTEVREFAADILSSLESAARAELAGRGLLLTQQLKPGWQEALLPQMEIRGIASLLLGTTVPVGNEADARRRLQDMTDQTSDIQGMVREVLRISQELSGKQANPHQASLRTTWTVLEGIQARLRALNQTKQATLSEHVQDRTRLF